MLDLETPVPYFDLSLQHASEPLLKRMRRWGSGDRFLAMIDGIRNREPTAAFRSSFIVGFPGETETDHETLLGFLDAAGLDWAGLFPFSPEEGTPAAGMDGAVDGDVVKERLDELSVVQDRHTQAARDALVGARVEVLVDGKEGGVTVGRTHREAPEIDGVVRVGGGAGPGLSPGTIVTAEVVAADGPDLVAEAS
jgi:ribosomal protein S12 methylthiotransferase